MNSTARLVGDFVRRVLDEFEKLAVTISALSDTPLAIGVFGHESRVHGVGLQDAGGLFENGLDHRRGRRRHCFCAPGLSRFDEIVSDGPAAGCAQPARTCETWIRGVTWLVRT
ncbi:hypothetical protein NA749_044085 [Streptomyces justiciae]|nr:hypothetical protein [Streptomyces justiciae]MCW8383817.1 hypothetical protein [Streptomyces justiciae]